MLGQILKKKLSKKYTVDYSKAETPEDYLCCDCGTTGVKLWRDYNTVLSGQELRCAACACKAQNKEDNIDAEGYGHDRYGKCDQIGWLVPAVPCEDDNTFWGYTSVPPAGVAWWRSLPTRSR